MHLIRRLEVQIPAKPPPVWIFSNALLTPTAPGALHRCRPCAQTPTSEPPGISEEKVFHSTVMHMRHIKSSSSNDIRAISIQQGERKWIDFMKDTLESEEGSHASSGDTQHALINANRVRRAANIQKPSELQSHTQINHLLPHSSPDNRSVAYGYQTSGLVKHKKIFV